MAIRTGWRAAAAAAGAVLVLSACGTTAEGGTAEQEGGGGGPVSGLQILVPNSPGSGYDTTARTAAQAMEDAGLASSIEVFNLEGAGGTVGLQRLVNEEGNEDLVMQMGLGVVGATYTNESEATLQQTTPLARLIEEAEAIVVTADSPYQTLDDLVGAWSADPGGVPVGGASSPGGPDYLTPMLLAQAVEIDPATVNYVSYDGGGELLAGVLGGQVAFGATGVGEVAEQAAAGELRILAVTSEEPVEGVDAPTLTEEGVDLVFTNWRGIVAAPGISEERTEELTTLIEDLQGSEQWQEALETNGWTDAFITGEEYATFLEEENDRVAGVLSELGLA